MIYDWIVVGAGFTGAALSYELIKKGLNVLLLEQDSKLENATRYSYGGLAFWSGNTPLTRQLCDEGIARQRILSEELDADTQFRELDLLLTIPPDSNPETVAAFYNNFAIAPQLLDRELACDLEPLLNKDAISGALTVKHGHINPEKTAEAYIQAFLRAGGEMQIAQVLQVQTPQQVKTTTSTYQAANVAVCAGGLSRELLHSSGIYLPLYFSHAEMIEISPVDIRLRTLVMPANLQRFQLEAESTKVDAVWDELDNQRASSILDAGAIQFLDGSLRLGQITRTLTDARANINPQESEAWLRSSIGEVLPALANLPGTWHHCLVAFSSDRLPLVGEIPGFEGVYIFSGFSNPLVFVPTLAQRFANWVGGNDDQAIAQISPTRFNLF